MRRIAPRMVFAILVGCIVGMCCTHHLAAQGPTSHKPIIVTRMFTGPDGQTKTETIDVKLTPVAGALAQWREDSETIKVASSFFVRVAPGFVEPWHNANARRYVITLSGEAEIELSGGKKIKLNAGSVLLAEDLTGKGHITRNAGKTDWIALFVQLANQ